ncbi:hypothetical protein BDN70DRAFT_818466 [Pholiota conissans]|uniref:Uncharacterized protein n=1 Tax=Pholiota conissans TaxID=109636 RepID=A0A9P5YQ17_9AGAR|nr:hypothetical protein BDN70DRAFT_818466 [Pholiota conissans]
MRLLGLVIFLWSVAHVLGNTEIVNFEAQETVSVDLQFTRSWYVPVLHSGSSTLIWNLTATPVGFSTSDICPSLGKWRPDDAESMKLCPHELWLALDLESDGHWKNFNKFTLRLSWPAFFPTDVSMKIYDPIDLAAFSENPQSISSHATSRLKYARLRLSFAGVLSPSAPPVPDGVPIFIILEPLFFGVLMPSVIPTILAIVVIVVLGIPTGIKINSYLQKIAQLARQNMSTSRKSD